MNIRVQLRTLPADHSSASFPHFAFPVASKVLSRAFTKPQNMLCYCFQETWHFALVLVKNKSSVYGSQSRIPFWHSDYQEVTKPLKTSGPRCRNKANHLAGSSLVLKENDYLRCKVSVS